MYALRITVTGISITIVFRRSKAGEVGWNSILFKGVTEGICLRERKVTDEYIKILYHT